MAEATRNSITGSKTQEQTLEEAKKKVKEFDYIRMTFIDFHGMPRTRILPTRHADRLLEHGWACYEGALYAGARSEIPDSLHDEHHKRLATSGNVDVLLDPSTLHAVPWAGNNEYKVCEILADLFFKDGTPLPTTPRFVAQKQLKRLDAMGLELMSSYEMEFILEDRKTHEPVFDGPDIFSVLVFAEHEKMFFQLDQQMLKAGINCEMMQTEYAKGQFEVTMVPVYGINGGDKAVQLKQGIKEIAHQYGLEATFMSKPDPEISGSGAHFNYSVWKKEDNSNAFFDANGTSKLSKFAWHWIGGMMRHGRALSALQSPTVNCYRRLQGAWAPSKVFWGIENRDSALRIKVGSPRSTYMENRLPSGSANHYLVLAATIAAGLDGVQNCIEPPAEGVENAETLPLNLAEALNCLEEDKALVEALGAEFVEWFCLVKRHVDLELLKDSDMTKPDPDSLAKERYMYNITI